MLLVEPGRFDWVDVADPSPGPGEVLLRAQFTGICGTDLHIVEGSHPRARLPLAIGHEMVGVPESGPLVGRQVLVDPLLPCGTCTACESGTPNACAHLRLIGIDRDGALAGRVAVASERLHPIPPGIPGDLATLAEPLAVAVHAVRRVPSLVGRLAVVLGGGPVGLLVAHVARRGGASVLIAEPIGDRRQLAGDLGFEVLDDRDPVRDLEDRTGGQLADVAFDAAAVPVVAALLHRVVRPGGYVAIVGAYSRPSPIDLQAVMFKELQIVGHRTYLPADIDAALRLLVDDQRVVSRLHTATVAPADIGKMIAKLRAGQGMKYVVQVMP